MLPIAITRACPEGFPTEEYTSQYLTCFHPLEGMKEIDVCPWGKRVTLGGEGPSTMFIVMNVSPFPRGDALPRCPFDSEPPRGVRGRPCGTRGLS